VNCDIDHLVIVASTLAQGAAWCEATLGVVPGPGGQHALMGTHNRLLSIASSQFPLAYLEIIAIDPAAPPPARTRWFGMDDLSLQAAVQQAPQLVHGVARTPNIEMHRWGLVNIGQNPGPALAAERDTPNGKLAWRILVRDDGALLCGGALPTLIQWQGVHPAEHLPASPVQLQAVALAGLPPRVPPLLRLRGVTTPDAGPAVQVVLNTPKGPVTLSSPQRVPTP
jgi:hypothetical protein